MPPTLTLTNVRHLDLATGRVGALGEVHVVDGRVARAPAPDARLVDGGAGVVMPGLWDAHVHMNQWASASRWIDVSQAGSPAEAAAMMASGRRARPGQQVLGEHAVGDQVLVGFGFRESLWMSSPTAADLDAAIDDLPAVVIASDVHTVWLNTAALTHFGLVGGGLLREQDAFALQSRLDDVPTLTMDAWVARASQAAARTGVVGVVDLTMAAGSGGWGPSDWQRRFRNGFDALRVRTGVYPQHLGRVADEGLHRRQVLDDHGLLTMGPVKVITDGTMTSRTAWCHDPYPVTGTGDPLPGHEHGMATVAMDELVEVLMRANALGLEVAVHAIGDRSVSQSLDAFAETQARGSIEHAQLVRPDDLRRMAALGIRASVQPLQMIDDRDGTDTIWADRAQHAYPFASMLAAGVEVSLGSDAPVTPIDPWSAIEAAVRRTLDNRESWHPEQALTLTQALLASTRGVHSLVVGADADLIVLPVNPFEVPDHEVHAISPTLTLVGGRVTWAG